MSKEMNKLLRRIVKYDLGIGILISLLIVLLSVFSNAIIYFIGICVSLANFVCSSYATEKFLSQKSNDAIVFLITILRLIIVISLALPFINNIEHISYYMAGFVSHYLILISCCIINRKGSV